MAVVRGLGRLRQAARDEPERLIRIVEGAVPALGLRLLDPELTGEMIEALAHGQRRGGKDPGGLGSPHLRAEGLGHLKRCLVQPKPASLGLEPAHSLGRLDRCQTLQGVAETLGASQAGVQTLAATLDGLQSLGHGCQTPHQGLQRLQDLRHAGKLAPRPAAIDLAEAQT